MTDNDVINHSKIPLDSEKSNSASWYRNLLGFTRIVHKKKQKPGRVEADIMKVSPVNKYNSLGQGDARVQEVSKETVPNLSGFISLMTSHPVFEGPYACVYIGEFGRRKVNLFW